MIRGALSWRVALVGSLLVACSGSTQKTADDLETEELPGSPRTRTPQEEESSSEEETTLPPAQPAPACDDGAKNGDETDVDCGGSCSAACASGKTCTAGTDCATSLCVASQCCSRTPAGKKTTGAVSGTKRICCDAGAVVAEVKDCGSGTNHSAVKVSAQCADAIEGAMNGGSSCAEITCVISTCKES